YGLWPVRAMHAGRGLGQLYSREPSGLSALEEARQLVGQVECGSLQRALIKRASVPPRDGGEGRALRSRCQEGEGLVRAKRRRQTWHDGSERPCGVGPRHERVDDRQQRLDGAGTGLGTLEEARLVDRECRGAGEQPENGEVARREARAVRQAVCVEDSNYAAADLERDGHG